MNWSPEQIATARQMWADDKSAGEIVKVIGVSRSAVLGFVHRHRDLFPNRPRLQAKRAASQQSQIATRRAVLPTPAPVLPAAPLPVANLPATIPMPFSEAIDLGRCLHFVGDPWAHSGQDMPVCGATRAEGAHPRNRYCRSHLRSVGGGFGR